jgi:hypothetical protein
MPSNVLEEPQVLCKWISIGTASALWIGRASIAVYEMGHLRSKAGVA